MEMRLLTALAAASLLAGTQVGSFGTSPLDGRMIKRPQSGGNRQSIKEAVHSFVADLPGEGVLWNRTSTFAEEQLDALSPRGLGFGSAEATLWRAIVLLLWVKGTSLSNRELNSLVAWALRERQASVSVCYHTYTRDKGVDPPSAGCDTDSGYGDYQRGKCYPNPVTDFDCDKRVCQMIGCPQDSTECGQRMCAPNEAACTQMRLATLLSAFEVVANMFVAVNRDGMTVPDHIVAKGAATVAVVTLTYKTAMAFVEWVDYVTDLKDQVADDLKDVLATLEVQPNTTFLGVNATYVQGGNVSYGAGEVTSQVRRLLTTLFEELQALFAMVRDGDFVELLTNPYVSAKARDALSSPSPEFQTFANHMAMMLVISTAMVISNKVSDALADGPSPTSILSVVETFHLGYCSPNKPIPAGILG